LTQQFEKHYTLEQANRMVPHVRRLFTELRALLRMDGPAIQEIGNMGGACHPATSSTDPAGPDSESAPGNNTHYIGPTPPALSRSDNDDPAGAVWVSPTDPEVPISNADYSEWSDEKRKEAAYRLVTALQMQGIVIQDLERGLIDFPSIRDGREVFLCYELRDGESIGFYHELEAGYAGRKPVTETRP